MRVRMTQKLRGWEKITWVSEGHFLMREERKTCTCWVKENLVWLERKTFTWWVRPTSLMRETKTDFNSLMRETCSHFELKTHALMWDCSFFWKSTPSSNSIPMHTSKPHQTTKQLWFHTHTQQHSEPKHNASHTSNVPDSLKLCSSSLHPRPWKTSLASTQQNNTRTSTQSYINTPFTHQQVTQHSWTQHQTQTLMKHHTTCASVCKQ